MPNDFFHVSKSNAQKKSARVSIAPTRAVWVRGTGKYEGYKGSITRVLTRRNWLRQRRAQNVVYRLTIAGLPREYFQISFQRKHLFGDCLLSKYRHRDDR